MQWLAVIDRSSWNTKLPKQLASQFWGSSKSNFTECWAAQAVQTRRTTRPLTATWCRCQISWISIRAQKWRTMVLVSGRPPRVPADSSWRTLGTCHPSGDLIEHHVMFARSNFYGQGQAAIQCKAIQLTQTYMTWPGIHCFTSIFILGLKEKEPCVACFLSLIFKYLSSKFRTHSSKHLHGTNIVPRQKPQQFCQPLYLDLHCKYSENHLNVQFICRLAQLTERLAMPTFNTWSAFVDLIGQHLGSVTLQGHIWRKWGLGWLQFRSLHLYRLVTNGAKPCFGLAWHGRGEIWIKLSHPKLEQCCFAHKSSYWEPDWIPKKTSTQRMRVV